MEKRREPRIRCAAAVWIAVLAFGAVRSVFAACPPENPDCPSIQHVSAIAVVAMTGEDIARCEGLNGEHLSPRFKFEGMIDGNDPRLTGRFSVRLSGSVQFPQFVGVFKDEMRVTDSEGNVTAILDVTFPHEHTSLPLTGYVVGELFDPEGQPSPEKFRAFLTVYHQGAFGPLVVDGALDRLGSPPHPSIRGPLIFKFGNPLQEDPKNPLPVGLLFDSSIIHSGNCRTDEWTDKWN